MTGAPPPADDAALAALVAAGDEAAFGALYDRHADMLFGAVVRFLRDRGAAEEVVQDAFVAFWRQADTYQPAAGTLVGWLLRIARNKAIDRARATARRPRLMTPVTADGRRPLDEQPADRIADPLDQPAETAERAWTRAVVRTALASMPETERRPLELAYDEGLTQTEVAERLGWPLGTVKTRTRRGLATLRGVLEAVPDLGGAGAARGAMTGGGDGPR